VVIALEGTGSLLSEEQRRLFVELWNRGVRLEDIARSVGIPVKKVSLYARILGLPPRRGSPWNKRIGDEELRQIIELWSSGVGVREIARRFGVTTVTILSYLNAMGLRKVVPRRRCPSIEREELERLCMSGLSDVRIAKIYNTTERCVRRIRERYGIRKMKIKKTPQRRYKKVEEIMRVLEMKCYTTTKELAEMGIKIRRRKALEELRKKAENIVIFKLERTSTTKYTILHSRLARITIIYLRGCEDKVVRFIVDNIVDKNIPPASIKSLLKRNGAPLELIQAVYSHIKQLHSTQSKERP
jgi:DNA-binding CsgD family transcriptional regulator